MTEFRRNSSRRRTSSIWLGGAVLVALELSTISFISTRAKAETSSAVLDAGEQILALTNETDTVSTVVVNGVSFRFISGSSVQSHTALLDRFQTHCRDWSRLKLPDFTKQREPMPGGSSTFGGLDHRGVFRVESLTRGLVVCLDTKGRQLEPLDIVRSALEFSRNGDLSVFGESRFFMAHSLTATTSRYLMIWNQGHFGLLRMFPAAGDVPGRDLLGVPRPISSRRRLSLVEPEHGFALVSYSVDVALDGVVAFRASLVEQGWDLVKLETPEAQTTFIAQRGARRILVTSQRVGADAWIHLMELQS